LTEFKQVLLEALAVALIGGVIALAANAISPRGLNIARNYFPGPAQGVVTPPALSPVASLRQKGLQSIDGSRARLLFKDPRLAEQRVAFIDARNDEEYRRAHIPGAYQFDPYYPSKFFAAILPVCQVAEEIVLYCNGGDCEDSQFAALTLRDAGIENKKLFVYVGGITDWTNRGFAIEIGERHSGNLVPGVP
jgi:rhodanese-related sulfurtransferase